MLIEYLSSNEFMETVAVIGVGLAVFAIMKMIDNKLLKSKNGNTRWYRSAKMMGDFIQAVIFMILILIILSINGVNVTKYAASLGIFGVIASFALQDFLKDITMGISIMFEGYFKVGDVVEYNGEVGKVVSFNIKTTKIFMLYTETTLSVCNRNISQIGICSDWVDVDVPIGYDVDLHYSRELCRECAKKIERLRYVYSCDFLNTQELAESWINYRLRVHCLPEKKPGVARNARAVIQDVFYEHKQEFPLSIKVLYNVDADETKADMPEGEKVVVKKAHDNKKKDYELGRGAATSKVVPYNGTEADIKKATAEAERYAISENLQDKMRLRLVLLTEELMSVTDSLDDVTNGSFYVERNDSDYELCFEATASIGKESRGRLLKVSNNRNEAYQGVSGMLLHAIDSMMLMRDNDANGVNSSSMNTMEESIGKADGDYKWSYNIYKEKEESEAEANSLEDIDIDELSTSVLTKLSDDIRISMRTNKISIRVLVKRMD